MAQHAGVSTAVAVPRRITSKIRDTPDTPDIPNAPITPNTPNTPNTPDATNALCP